MVKPYLNKTSSNRVMNLEQVGLFNENKTAGKAIALKQQADKAVVFATQSTLQVFLRIEIFTCQLHVDINVFFNHNAHTSLSIDDKKSRPAHVQFIKSKKKKINGLKEKNCFEVISILKVPKKAKLFH